MIKKLEELFYRNSSKEIWFSEEVASAALFFTLPGSSYINGTVFPIDGGFNSSGIIKNEFLINSFRSKVINFR